MVLGALKIPTALGSRVDNLMRFETVLPRYFGQLTSVNSKLHSIKDKFEEIRTEPSFLIRFLGAKGYVEKLKDLEKDLKNARTDLETHRSQTGWSPGTGVNAGLWTCNGCSDNRWFKLRDARRHQAGRMALQGDARAKHRFCVLVFENQDGITLAVKVHQALKTASSWLSRECTYGLPTDARATDRELEEPPQGISSDRYVASKYHGQRVGGFKYHDQRIGEFLSESQHGSGLLLKGDALSLYSHCLAEGHYGDSVWLIWDLAACIKQGAGLMATLYISFVIPFAPIDKRAVMLKTLAIGLHDMRADQLRAPYPDGIAGVTFHVIPFPLAKMDNAIAFPPGRIWESGRTSKQASAGGRAAGPDRNVILFGTFAIAKEGPTRNPSNISRSGTRPEGAGTAYGEGGQECEDNAIVGERSDEGEGLFAHRERRVGKEPKHRLAEHTTALTPLRDSVKTPVHTITAGCGCPEDGSFANALKTLCFELKHVFDSVRLKELSCLIHRGPTGERGFKFTMRHQPPRGAMPVQIRALLLPDLKHVAIVFFVVEYDGQFQLILPNDETRAAMPTPTIIRYVEVQAVAQDASESDQSLIEFALKPFYPATKMVLTIVMLGLIATYYVWLHLNKPNKALPPGPKPLPIVGNITNLTAQELWLRAPQWAKSYGDVGYLHVFGQGLVFLNECGCENTVTFTQHGHKSRRQRRPMQHALAVNSIRAYQPLLEVETQDLLKRLLRDPEDYVGNLRRYAGGLTLTKLYGYHASTNDDKLLTLADECVDILSNRIASGGGIWPMDIFPLLQHLPDWSPGAGFKRKAAIWKTKVKDFINNPFEFVKDHMELQERCEKEMDSQHDVDICWTGNSMYSVSIDITMTTMLHFILAIVQHPEVLAKAQCDIDRVIGPGRLPTFSDRSSLPYIECVMSEVLRWGVPVPLSLPHHLMEDDVYNGMYIPKGPLVYGNVWNMVRNPTLFPDPDTFVPERYLAPADEATMRRRDPRNYVFGFGRRQRPGTDLIEQSLWIVMASMVATLNISKARDAAGCEVEPEVVFDNAVFRMPRPFRCDIRPRSEQVLRVVRQAADADAWMRGCVLVALVG
ncbi:predicted protein [Postia placenta Mad-698-R]|nr:predicted protein [Postia placenta Mad-698-R]